MWDTWSGTYDAKVVVVKWLSAGGLDVDSNMYYLGHLPRNDGAFSGRLSGDRPGQLEGGMLSSRYTRPP